MKNELSIEMYNTEGSAQGPGFAGAKKLTEWNKEPSVMDLKRDLDVCKTMHDNHVNNVTRWNDLRMARDGRVKKIKGRSSIQPKLIRRQNEWRYSALSEPFLSSPDIFDIEPHTWEDEHAARQNHLVLNWQFRTKLNKVKFIDEYVRTAVDEGTVIVRLGWERITEKKMVTEPVWEMVELKRGEEDELKEALDLRQKNPRDFRNFPEELQAAIEYFDETGVPVRAIQARDEFTGEPLTEEVEEIEVLKNQPTLEIMHPENIYIDPSCDGDIEKAKFVIVSYETTKADLLKDGRYSNLDKVNWSGNKILAQPDHATQAPQDFQMGDELRNPIVAYEYWGWYDVDGKEKLTPIIASWIGDVMIRMEENPFPDEKPPFVVVPYLPIKRSVFGEPDAELLEDNQAVLGAMMRGMIDLLGRSANSQTGHAKGFLDVTNKRRFEQGQDYEFNPGSGDPRAAVFQHVYPDIPQSALTMVQLQNQEAEAMSGVKAFSGGLSGEAYGDVAAGIKGMLDASAKREMNILRRLANGMIQIGRKIAAMNAIFMNEEEVVRVTNRSYEVVRREDLKGNFDMVVDINTPEVDEAKAQDLGFMLQTMGPNMDLEMNKKILSQIARLKRMPVLAQEIADYQPQPDPVQEKAKELELLKLEAEIGKIQSEIEENKAQAQKAKSEADLNELEFVEQESGTAHARDMEKIESQAEANQDLEITKAFVTPKKEGEAGPDIEAAVGFNALSKGRPSGFGTV